MHLHVVTVGITIHLVIANFTNHQIICAYHCQLVTVDIITWIEDNSK